MIEVLLSTRSGPEVPSWVGFLLVGAFDVYFSCLILSLVRRKPIVKGDVRVYAMRLGLILTWAAVFHALGVGYTSVQEGPSLAIVWVVMLAALAAWLLYAWKRHREALLEYRALVARRRPRAFARGLRALSRDG